MFAGVGLMWVLWLAITAGLVMLVLRGTPAGRASSRAARRRGGDSETSL